MHAKTLILAALLGATAVLMGAYQAHGLPRRLAASGVEDAAARLHNTEVAVRYQMFHALALFGLALIPGRSTWLQAATTLWILGMLCFCGGLYSHGLTGHTLHWIIPIGGLLMIFGWLGLAMFGVRQRGSHPSSTHNAQRPASDQ